MLVWPILNSARMTSSHLEFLTEVDQGEGICLMERILLES